MSSTLPPITVPIVGDISGLVSAFSKVATSAKKFSTTLETKLAPMRAGINNLGGAALKVVAPIAAAATAFASFASVMASFERADSLGKMSGALGIAVDKLAKLHYASMLNQGSAEGMNAALMKMEKFLGDAANGGAEAQKSLGQLGLRLKDVAGLSPDQAFGRMADAMNTVQDQGQKMNLMMQVFGKNSKEVAALVKSGSAGITAMGDEGERLGRTLSRVDYGKIMAAKDAVERMQTAFVALADRVTTALAPVFNWVATSINEWIGNTKDFEGTFDAMARGVVMAIGVVRTAWEGLLLLWEGAKVVVGSMSVAFYKAADGIVYAVKWIGSIAGKTWDFVAASFNATKDALVVGWRWVSDQVIGILGTITEAFGRHMRDMGQAMIGSGVKGMIEIGDSLASAGADLIVGSVRLRQGSGELLASAKADLDTSVAALESARDAFNQPAAITTGMEGMVQQAQAFRDSAVQAFDDIAYRIANMEGGNPFADTLAGYEKSLIEYNKNASAIAEEGATERVIISTNAAAMEQAIIDAGAESQKKTWEDYWIELLERKQQAMDELDLITMDNQTLQAARQEAFNAEQELEEQKHVDAQVMLWESGAMGKMAAIGGVLNNLASLMQSKNKSLFMIGKVAAMAQNVIDTIASAASSYAFGARIGGPITGGVFAATAVLAGVVRAQQIMSTQIGGGGMPGGGSSGGGASTSGADAAKSQAAAAEKRNVNVTLYGDNFSGTQVRGLIAAINEQTGDNMSLKAQVSK